jgi:hypothetical protein
MASYNFESKIIIARKDEYVTFLAMLVDSNNDPVSGITFIASEVKVLQYLSSAWDISNISKAPTEIGSTGVYYFELNPSEVNPDAYWYPIGIVVNRTANGNSIHGFFSIRINPVTADVQELMSDSLGDNLATLKLAKIHVKNYLGEVPVWDDAVVIEGKSAIRAEGNDDAAAAMEIINREDGDGFSVISGQGNGMCLRGGVSGLYCDGDVGLYALGATNGIRAQVSSPASGAGLLAVGNGGPGIEARSETENPGILAQGGFGDANGFECKGIGAGSGAHFEGGANDVYETAGLFCEGGGPRGGYGIRAEDGIYLVGHNDSGHVTGHSGQGLTIAGYEKSAIKIVQGGTPPEYEPTIAIVGAGAAQGIWIAGGPTKPAIHIQGGLPATPAGEGGPGILINRQSVDDGYASGIVVKGIGSKPGIEINGGAESDGVLIDGKTFSNLVEEALADTDTSFATALKEILSYATGTLIRNVDTGTITYKNRAGTPIFTLTPAIDGRIRIDS